MDDLSQLPAIAEPWFLALNAAIEVMPAMTPEDLMKAGSRAGCCLFGTNPAGSSSFRL
jgi:hypothetical protein